MSRTLINIIIVLVLPLYLLSLTFNGCEYNEYENKKILYNTSTTFTIKNDMPESYTHTFLTKECMFLGNYSDDDCKTYTNMYLDMSCELYQEKNVSNYYLYLSPEFYYNYDSRLNIYNKTIYSNIHLPYSLSCQNNNVCVYISNFVLSYKNWNDVPFGGNYVDLICDKFIIWTF